jgi:hypothetical protein
VTAPQPVAVIDDIPGSDRPSWGHPPPANDERPHDPNMARRVHATITATFPDETGATRDRWRHALVAVITRKRPDGPATSSNDLSYEEQLALSDVLARIAAGQASVADGPDDTIEVRAGGGWRYTVTLDPINVAVRRGDDQPEQENP